MTWNEGFPQTSGSLDSLPIRDNFRFLKTGLDVHASCSANPHSTTLDQVIVANPVTNNLIDIQASGSVIHDLRIQQNLQIGGQVVGNLKLAENVYINYDGPEGDSYLYFYDTDSPVGVYIEWDNSTNRFIISKSLYVDGEFISISCLTASQVYSNGNMCVNRNGPDGDAYIYFYDGDSPTGRSLKWNDALFRFEFDESLCVDGDVQLSGDLGVSGSINANTITISSSGSILKSLNIVNNLQVGESLIADHNTLSNLDGGTVDEYYHLENVEHSALVDGGSADSYHTHPSSGSGGSAVTGTILLSVGGAILPDGTAGSAAAQPMLITTSDADDPQLRLMVLAFDDTTDEQCFWQFAMKPDYVSGGRLKVQFYTATDQTGVKYVDFQASLIVITPDADADEMTSLDATNDSGGFVSGVKTLANNQANDTLLEATINLSANLDGLAANDFVYLSLKRNAAVANDATGDARVVSVRFEYNY
jgi:hypothetical protein